MSFDLGNYVDVAERIVRFYEQNPDGRIAATPADVITIGDRTFLAVTARVWRTADDPQPCVGSAWEPWPGRTPYTKDSEAMNAETSAVGRALALAGIETKRGVASANEIQARKAERKPAAKEPDTVSSALTRKAMALFTECGMGDRDARLEFTSSVVERDIGSWNDVSGSEAQKVVDALEKLKTHRNV